MSALRNSNRDTKQSNICVNQVGERVEIIEGRRGGLKDCAGRK